GYEGAKCVCSPPPRDRQNQEAVWRALAHNVFSVFSSDHAPFSYDDVHGKKLNGKEQKFQYIPNGIPGLETRLPLLFSGGVASGRISLHQFVALTSTQPAKLYGLYPRKGSIMIGADADIALWDRDLEVRISNDRLHHAVDYTPYEGRTVTGWPVMTFSRGRLVSQDFEFLGRAGEGEFMPCGQPIL
ncbi:MAG: amidohydrolase family protein, partial [Castellaniella sp.]